MSHRNYRRKLITSLHPLVSTWQTNVTANGGTYNDTDSNALSNFLFTIDSFKTKFKRLNLLMGGDFLAARTPVIYEAQGGILDGNTNFVSGDYSPTSGLQGAATKKLYADYYPNLDADWSVSNHGLGFFNKTTGTDWNTEMLINSSTTGFIIKAPGDICYYYSQNGSGASHAITGSNELGLITVKRVAADGAIRLYRNGVQQDEETKAGSAAPTNKLEIFGGSPRLGVGYYVENNLTETELTTLYSAWATLNTALGR